MSNETTTLATKNTSLTALQSRFEELDKFAADNSVTSLLAGDVGAFALTLKMSSAMEQLRAMITPEMMKPIMALQGSALGFRTDKDKEGGYKEEVVKEVLIEATLKGFRMVNNETNIIGGRFYAARDGFERIFRDLAKQGRVTNLLHSPGIPKTTADGSLVEYSSTWTFKTDDGTLINDSLKSNLSIRVNNGQGPDAILGKAKRKQLAAIYSRITGTVITDGEVDDPKTIDITPAGAKQETTVPALPADLLGDLEAVLKPYEEQANKYLVGNGSIREGQTFRNVTEAMGRKIIKQRASFLEAIGVK